MKKILVAIVALCAFVACVNEQAHTQIQKEKLSLQEDVYKLYPTDNRWNFIKLNTADGRLWQVQYDINGENRFESALNLLTRAKGEEIVNGRFELYPTQNMYNFILLDQIDGRVWQVQWSIERENRMVLEIK